MTDTSRVHPSGYPEWICSDCGTKYGRRAPTIATWSVGECDICGRTKPVTEPSDYGNLKHGWHLAAIETLAKEVLDAASIDDQTFIDCLQGDDDATTRLRLAIVSLAEIVRTAF
jgi:hypothetical protein